VPGSRLRASRYGEAGSAFARCNIRRASARQAWQGYSTWPTWPTWPNWRNWPTWPTW